MRKMSIIMKLTVLIAVFMVTCSKNSPTEPTTETVKANADFSIESIDNIVPVTVNFVSNSKNCNSYQWDFGNGATSSDENPSQTFEVAANYEIKLIVSGDHGIDSTKKMLELIDPPATIIMDKEAAGIKINKDKIARVEAVHGKDYDERLNAVGGKVRWIIQYRAKGLTFWTDKASDQSQRSAVEIAYIRIEPPYKGITDRGIGIGSTREQVETAYPEGSYYDSQAKTYYIVGSSAFHITDADVVDWLHVGHL